MRNRDKNCVIDVYLNTLYTKVIDSKNFEEAQKSLKEIANDGRTRQEGLNLTNNAFFCYQDVKDLNVWNRWLLNVTDPKWDSVVDSFGSRFNSDLWQLKSFLLNQIEKPVL